eukprot:239209-Amphidinium_carterae.1
MTRSCHSLRQASLAENMTKKLREIVSKLSDKAPYLRYTPQPQWLASEFVPVLPYLPHFRGGSGIDSAIGEL